MMMGTVCADHQHKFHHSHQLLSKKPLRDIDIPPRKQLLLGRRADSESGGDGSPAFSKFLPCNDSDDSDSDDPYSSDHFRMYEFKVRKCNRSRSHDWTDCPFAHPGEKARRRDPRRFRYSGTVCPEFRKGHCGKGDACEFSHGVFECWLHPSRYRTEACKDGKSCKRKVCFFAHSSRQLRIVPDSDPAASPEKKSGHHCCLYCHCSMSASPTSTLMGHMAHNTSPPLSPLGERGGGGGGGASYALAELMASFEAMSPSATAGRLSSPPWLDVNFNVEEPQPQFVMSPSTPVRRGHSKFYSGESKFSPVEYSGRNLVDDGRFAANDGGSGGPDLGWVNDLLT
ncbi:zinc finger CCCH domain-containing protein 2-like [Salvia divinorum]|uniref:Zinc finger CCCH domain-containing protein 2-like n=1 Tax=Salvia divinorum TaxID=28513 RepID=A0ABD1HJ74_SALDI